MLIKIKKLGIMLILGTMLTTNILIADGSGGDEINPDPPRPPSPESGGN